MEFNEVSCMCGNEVSIRKNSFFAKTHLSYEQVFIFVHEWLNYSEIQRIMLETDISSSVATNGTTIVKMSSSILYTIDLKKLVDPEIF